MTIPEINPFHTLPGDRPSSGIIRNQSEQLIHVIIDRIPVSRMQHHTQVRLAVDILCEKGQAAACVLRCTRLASVYGHIVRCRSFPREVMVRGLPGDSHRISLRVHDRERVDLMVPDNVVGFAAI